MDVATHILLGACVAQIPRTSARESSQALSFWQRSLIGGLAAVFPDIDYLLFFYHPLEFLAYWHRAETHSLLLAPFWSLLTALLWSRRRALLGHRAAIFWICLLSILSHIFCDTLTGFGIQWFAPLSDMKFSWNLLFVIDAYFSLSILLTFLWLFIKQKQAIRYWAFLLPLGYLFLLGGVKYSLTHGLVKTGNMHESELQVTLLPQPLSPLYWQAIGISGKTTKQAYIKYASDPVALLVGQLIGKSGYSAHFHEVENPSWNSYLLLPLDIKLRKTAEQAWYHPEFKAYRDFAVFPIFYRYDTDTNLNCYWFSDLRYHWPEFIPSFRYGMCHSPKGEWRLYRMKYLSKTRIVIN